MMGWKKLCWMLHTYGFLNPYNEWTLAYSQIFSLKSKQEVKGVGVKLQVHT